MLPPKNPAATKSRSKAKQLSGTKRLPKTKQLSKASSKAQHWHPTLQDSAMLLVESQFVIGLRLFHLATGGVAAHHEAHLMVSEKIDAFAAAAATMAGGGSARAVCRDYRRRVRANAKRLVSASR
jgi:hypothetical protein